MNYRKKVRLGDVLVKKGIIDENQLQTALSRQREQGKMLGEMVIALGYATQKDINEALCDSLGIDFVDMRETDVSEDVLSVLDESIMRKYTLVPLGDAPDNPGAIRVAMADPTNILAMDDINIVTGKQVVPVLANASDINAFLIKHLDRSRHRALSTCIRRNRAMYSRKRLRKIRREEKKSRMRLSFSLLTAL